MIFSYNWLQSFFEKKLPQPKKLAEILTMHSFEVEGVKKVKSDYVLDIDILSNRISDCASHIGIAREIGAISGFRLQVSDYKLKEDKKRKTTDVLGIRVEDKNLCPRYCARALTDVKVAPAPKWIRERLIACGVEPINNVVDAANYTMLEIGQPLHAFDFDKISGVKNQKPKESSGESLRATGKNQKSIIVRKARKGEKITALDGKTYLLEKDNLVIADSKEAIAIAGVKGGKKAEVKSSTKTVVLEAANFDRLNIYRTSKRLKLQTDASLRFSSGLALSLPEEGIERVCSLIQKIAGGKILKGKIDFYPRKVLPKKIKLDLNYLQNLLGKNIPRTKIIKIFKNLGFVIHHSSSAINRQLLIEVPTFRKDISIPEDLIEEIGRIYGYQEIQSKIPVLPMMIPKGSKEFAWARKIKELMRGLGFIEVYNYSFISQKDSQFFTQKPLLVEIENPVSSNTKYLRPSLLPNLLKVIQRNQARFKNVNIFEIGKTFQKTKTKKQQVQEKSIFSGVISGKEKFYELKGKIEALLNSLGISNLFFDSYQPTLKNTKIDFWQRKNTAKIKIDDTEIGFLGQISDKILDFYQVKEPVFSFEIDFEKVFEFVLEEHEYKAPSSYPEMIRDLAILVPTEVLAGEVIQKIHFGGGKIIRDVEIFDIFEGPPLPKGKKNLAFHIIYQAKDRTLTSKEVDKIQEKIIRLLEENPSWEVRK